MTLKYTIKEFENGFSIEQNIARSFLDALLSAFDEQIFEARVSVVRAEDEVISITISGLIPLEGQDEKHTDEAEPL